MKYSLLEMDFTDTTAATRLERTGFVLLLVAFFLFGLFDHSLWSPNDCREGAMIWDMHHNGTWVTASLNGKPYLEKPPLLHWTGVIFCRLFGTVSEGLVRLPAALYGLGAVLIAYLFALQLGRERAGMVAAFMCGTSVLYIEYSKVVLTDTALTFMVMLSLYLFWRAYTVNKPGVIRYGLFVLVSALSFYAKGLLGPGFVWVSIGAFLLFKKKWKLLAVLSMVFCVIFILVLSSWIWFLWKAGGNDFLKGVFWDNQFGRFLHFHGENLPLDPYFVHKEHIWFYALNLPWRTMPWILLVAPAVISWFRKSSSYNGELATFLKFALVCMALILHTSSAKVACYALPTYPILFLMTAVWLEDFANTWDSRIGRWCAGITAGLVLMLAFLLPIAYVIMYFMPQGLCRRFDCFHGVNVVKLPGATTAAIDLVAAIFALLIGAYAVRQICRKLRAGRRADVLMTLPLFVAAAAILGGTIVAPAVDLQRSFKPFVALVKSETTEGCKLVLATKEERYIGAFTFYLNTRLPVLTKSYQIRDFLIYNSPAAVIMEQKHVKTLCSELPPDRFKIMKTNPVYGKSSQFRLIVSARQLSLEH